MKHTLPIPRGLAAAVAIACLATPLLAQSAPPGKAERTIEYRKSAMTLLGWNIGPVAGMVKGEIPWDQQALETHALRLAQVAPMLLEGFPPGTETGAHTEAKPGIWKNMDDFKSKMHDLEVATARLAEVAKGGDRKAVAGALGDVGGACKACHDDYRADD